MPQRVLDLQPITLTCSAEDLKLIVTPNLTFNIPSSGLSSLSNIELIKALEEGQAWVYRGRAFSLEIQCNGRLLEGFSQVNILESLSCHLRDAHVGDISLFPFSH